MPNEFDVQKSSGVYDQLLTLPFYSKYVPNKMSKQSVKYDLWGRQTLQFNTTCKYTIEQALSSLRNFEGVTETISHFKDHYIKAFVFFGLTLIMIIF